MRSLMRWPGRQQAPPWIKLDDIVYRINDQADPTGNADDLARGSPEQLVLRSVVRTTVLYDLTEAIVDKRPTLSTEARLPPSGPAGLP